MHAFKAVHSRDYGMFLLAQAVIAVAALTCSASTVKKGKPKPAPWYRIHLYTIATVNEQSREYNGFERNNISPVFEGSWRICPQSLSYTPIIITLNLSHAGIQAQSEQAGMFDTDLLGTYRVSLQKGRVQHAQYASIMPESRKM
jgi:hypothetical protein